MGVAAAAHFNGADYVPARDDQRLSVQFTTIFELMSDHEWRTLPDIERETSYPQASISAQLRHMRKERFGGHTVARRYIGDGLYEYAVNRPGTMNPVRGEAQDDDTR